MVNEKTKIVVLTVGLIKKTEYNDSIFPRTKIFRKKSES